MSDVWRVFDENVLVVANGRSDQADRECVAAAIDEILAAQESGRVVFCYDFLAKYASHCSHAGQPGVGDQFFVWLRDHAAELDQVEIEWDAEGSPTAFPLDPALAPFDFDDRIWVAGVLAAAQPACVVNCVDSDYSQFADELSAAGVAVKELCSWCLINHGSPM
jgi:hypothetical protein